MYEDNRTEMYEDNRTEVLTADAECAAGKVQTCCVKYRFEAIRNREVRGAVHSHYVKLC